MKAADYFKVLRQQATKQATKQGHSERHSERCLSTQLVQVGPSTQWCAKCGCLMTSGHSDPLWPAFFKVQETKESARRAARHKRANQEEPKGVEFRVEIKNGVEVSGCAKCGWPLALHIVQINTIDCPEGQKRA